MISSSRAWADIRAQIAAASHRLQRATLHAGHHVCVPPPAHLSSHTGGGVPPWRMLHQLHLPQEDRHHDWVQDAAHGDECAPIQPGAELARRTPGQLPARDQEHRVELHNAIHTRVPVQVWVCCRPREGAGSGWTKAGHAQGCEPCRWGDCVCMSPAPSHASHKLTKRYAEQHSGDGMVEQDDKGQAGHGVRLQGGEGTGR